MKQPMMMPNQTMPSSFPPSNITTDQIQKCNTTVDYGQFSQPTGHDNPVKIYISGLQQKIQSHFLDENKQLILAIMNNQNLGKLAECAQYQALLQKNLMYLAAIADAQPPTSTPTPTPTPTISSQMNPVPLPGIPQQGGVFYMQQHPQAAVMAQHPPGFPQQISAMQFNNSPQVIQPQMGVRSGGPPSSAASDVWRASTQDGGAAASKDGHTGATGASEEAK